MNTSILPSNSYCRLWAFTLVLCASGCASGSNVQVGLSDRSVPPTAEWDELPEAVRAQYFAMAEVADPDQQLDRPPYPVGGMAGLMRSVTYPKGARRHGVEGTVIVRAVIAADGSVAATEIVQSVHPLLDAEALTTIRRARYEPATKDGQPVTAEVYAPFRFSLR